MAYKISSNSKIKKERVEVEYKKNMPKGYIGMNKYASKSLHIPYHHKANMIEIDKGLSKKMKHKTYEHEKAEIYFMKEKHLPYEKAHRKALKYEKEN